MRQKFIIGDIVRVLKNHDDNKVLVGQVGEIVAYRSCANSCADHALYGVKFKDKIHRCHDLWFDGKSRCAEGHGWWLPAAKLELRG